MKISKERLIELINEEVEKTFGTDSVTRSDRAKVLRQKVKDASKEKGVDTKERGIIQQIEKNLTILADLTNIKSGSTFSLLKKLNLMMEKEIIKIRKQGAQNEK